MSVEKEPTPAELQAEMSRALRSALPNASMTVEPMSDDDEPGRRSYAQLEARVKELEALLTKQAGSWTICAVCGASARNATSQEILHRIKCPLAVATGAPRGIDECTELTPELWAAIEKRSKP